MTAITFQHPNVGVLKLRLAPVSISWTYNMNTNVIDTYAGQVIQLLSINFNQLILEGRFGKEGPHGKRIRNNRIRNRRVGEFRHFKTNGRLAVGLTQMAEYFQRYFSVASQGRDRFEAGHYDQRPITLRYRGALDSAERKWVVYPTNFPSFKRSLEDFAPEWRVEFEVVEPDWQIKTTSMNDQIKRLRAAVGYQPFSPYSDPLGATLPANPKKRTKAAIAKAVEQAHMLNDAVSDHFRSMLPAVTEEDLNELIFFDASLANIYADLVKKNHLTSSAIEEHIDLVKKQRRNNG